MLPRSTAALWLARSAGLVNLAFRQSLLTYRDVDVAYLACYALCVLVTWAVYFRSPGRPGERK